MISNLKNDYSFNACSEVNGMQVANFYGSFSNNHNNININFSIQDGVKYDLYKESIDSDFNTFKDMIVEEFNKIERPSYEEPIMPPIEEESKEEKLEEETEGE